MNWTGGALQRTKRANRGNVQKQKAHFARARSHLTTHTPLRNAPFSPNIFGGGKGYDGLKRRVSSRYQSVHGSPHSPTMRQQATNGNHDRSMWSVSRSKSNASKSRLLQPSRYSRAVQHEVLMPVKGSQSTRGDVDEASAEGESLEAKKRKLLQQSDWIGLATSRPPSLHFRSHVEKSKVGRRRKLSSDYKAIKEHRTDATPAALVSRSGKTDPFLPLMSGALPTIPESIRIRIGTDALTTVSPTQFTSHSLSFVSSEPMLYDDQAHRGDDSRVPSIMDGTREAQHFDADRPSKNDTASSESMLTEEYEDSSYGQPRPRPAIAQSKEPALDVFGDDAYSSELRTQTSSRVGDSSRRNATPELQIMQYFDGKERPLRLVFESSNSSAGARSSTALQLRHGMGTYFQHATDPGVGNMRPGHDCLPDMQTWDAPSATFIADEDSWKLFLAVTGERSSQSFRATESRLSDSHGGFPAQIRNHHPNWSRCSTRGVQTHVISPPAPLPRPAGRIGEAAGLVDLRRIERVDQSHRAEAAFRDVVEDEEGWRHFIFGSEENTPSGLSQERRDRSGTEGSRASSGYLPLSAAVSSINATPLRTLPAHASFFDEATQKGQKYRLNPAAKHLSSPDMQRARSVDPEDGDEATEGKLAECSQVGEDAVTHASTLNNASCNSNLAVFEIDGDLDWSTSDARRHVNYNTTDNDEWNLDLVDPEALE